MLGAFYNGRMQEGASFKSILQHCQTSLPCLNISLYLTNARRCSWRLVQCFEAGQRTEEAGLAGLAGLGWLGWLGWLGEKYSIHLNNFPFIKPDCGQLGRGWEGHTFKAKVIRV